MIRRASMNFVGRFSLFALIIACTLCARLSANGNSTSRYQTGVRNSPDRPLNPKQLSSLLENLRQKSGFREMHFDPQGFLRLGDRSKIDGGSTAARELLIAAVDRAKAIDLENHNRTSQIAFARLAMPVSFTSRESGAHVEVYPVQIDFSDFAHLRGDKKAIEAFDIGFVVLHELGHAALGLRDALVNGQEPGECEEFINQIRRELGVAERQSYAAHTFTRRNLHSQSPSRQAELLFINSLVGGNKNKSFSLSWDAGQVGAVKPGEYKPQTIPQRQQSSLAP
ncbi:MAG: hypothetical protein SF097_26150 [Acidobacteriota bacterium]|nr:hypothetical protein [Acidobacteriota bacterium]